MSVQPSFPIPPTAQQGDGTTGRLIITFREDAVTAGLTALKQAAGVAKLPSAADYEGASVNMDHVDAAGGVVFPTLGIAVITVEEGEAVNNLMAVTGEGSAILAVEPERIFYALGDGTLSLSYLRGYRDAVNHLYEVASGPRGRGRSRRRRPDSTMMPNQPGA